MTGKWCRGRKLNSGGLAAMISILKADGHDRQESGTEIALEHSPEA